MAAPFRWVRQGYGVIRQGLKIATLICALFPATTALADETLTIAALGDSLTQGFGLPQDEGFVPQLEQWLKAQGHDVKLINAGVSGDTTAGGLARIDWTLTPDVDAVIVALGGNDLLRGIDPGVSRSNLDGILAKAKEKHVAALLIGLQAPGNYGPDFKAAFEAMYPELAAKYGALHEESFLRGLIESGADVADVMQGDGIHPNARGVAIIVNTLGPKVEELIQQIKPES